MRRPVPGATVVPPRPLAAGPHTPQPFRRHRRFAFWQAVQCCRLAAWRQVPRVACRHSRGGPFCQIYQQVVFFVNSFVQMVFFDKKSHRLGLGLMVQVAAQLGSYRVMEALIPVSGDSPLACHWRHRHLTCPSPSGLINQSHMSIIQCIVYTQTVTRPFFRHVLGLLRTG